jgi:4-hydroxy-tetrahydrodipicolinate synthase/4-hydroxy-2-oxoglutarate aldolase
MKGTGVPLVTPFDEDGEINEQKLRNLVNWVVDMGVDFIVPCGSNSEVELLTVEERAKVVEIVVESSAVPVMAGAGHPGFKETSQQVQLASQAGADSALVVTPFYYDYTQEELATYYRDIANESEIPIYLYSVPAFTDVELTPETVGKLSSHENIHGIKDSSGDIQNLQRLIRHSEKSFNVLVGSGGVYAQALGVGAAGGVLALSNVAPDKANEIHSTISEGKLEKAYRLNRKLVDLNHAVTANYGVPGLKTEMRARGAPAGHVRRPFQPVSKKVADDIDNLIEEAL